MTHISSMTDILNKIGREADLTEMRGKERMEEGSRMTEKMAKNVEQLMDLLKENVNSKREF